MTEQELERKAEEFFGKYCPKYWHRKSDHTFRSKNDYIEFIHLSEYEANELLFREPEFWEAINTNTDVPADLQEYAEALWILKNLKRKVQS